METLNELLLEELKDLYSAEKQIVKSLPRIVKGAQSEALKEALQEHLEITRVQVTRLEDAFSQLDQKAKAKHCKGMEGLLEEGAQCLNEEEAGAVRDLQLIGACQRVEHYEIAAYGTAKTIAEKIGLPEVANLLNETLQEEAQADTKLTEVAEEIYVQAGTNEEEDEDEENEEDDQEEVTEDEDSDEEDREEIGNPAQPRKRAASATRKPAPQSARTGTRH
jgi:ferritin-like metal-binding protein YciE